jgi:hypothetical protein
VGLKDIPGRAFLDTSVINFWLDHGEEISEGISPSSRLPEVDQEDIESLHCLYMTGQRASWQLAISPHTYQEVMNTTEPNRRHYLETWFFEIWSYWQEIIRENNDLPSFIEAEAIKVRVLSSGVLNVLPDVADRILILDALVYKCDVFCTRDRRTIIRHRDQLSSIGIPIFSPTEWWHQIEPYSSIWW